MSRQAAEKIPSIDIPKKYLTERMRRVAAMLKDNPNCTVETNDLLSYIMSSNKSANPSEIIKVNRKVTA